MIDITLSTKLFTQYLYTHLHSMPYKYRINVEKGACRW